MPAMRSDVSPMRVLIADGSGTRLNEVTRTVAELGHEVIPRRSGLLNVPEITAAELPDVAIVIVSEGSDQALHVIDQVVHEATCPVIAVLDLEDRAFVNEAAKRGIFAYVSGASDPVEMQSAIDIVLRRFAEYHALEGAFGRRAVTERAKGILMERHGVDERAAFDMLRDSARRSNRKLIDVAEGVVKSRALLPGRPPERDDAS
jgi:response regulator NasT